MVRFEQTHFVIRSSGAIALGHRGRSHEHSGTVQKRRAAVFCKRELAVLRLLAKEQSSQQIGDTLSIEKRTAEVYIQLITAKLRAVNGTHAVAVAIRNKII